MHVTTTTLLDPAHFFSRVGVNPGMRVADFGCGSHAWLTHHAVKTVGEEGQVYAVDVRPEALAILQQAHRGFSGGAPLETIWSDIERYGATSIPHASLDRIFVVNVVSLLEDISAALREGERLLAPDGKILVVDWALGDHPLAPSEIIPPELVVRAADDTGLLSATDIFSAGPHHYGIIISRC